MPELPELPEIGPLFEDGVAIDAALAGAALSAQREARALGRPLVVWENDHLTEVPTDQIPGRSPASTPSTTG